MPPASTVSISRRSLENLGTKTLSEIILKLSDEHPALVRVMQDLIVEAGGDERLFNAVPEQESADDTYMVGASAEMLAVYEAIRRCARCDAPVLIRGESGTGKELAALAIHERSASASGPFVPVNCGGLPSELIASEMFGHEKGAFTGAVSQRIGRIQEAEGGTLFLDEIGDLPFELQAHLLRFLQDRIIQRVGSNSPIRINTRIVAATNVDLEAAVSMGRFRRDLFYRLDVLRLRMPALRNRRADIPLLVRYFLDRLAREMDVSPGDVSDDAMSLLTHYHWPGNVRELVSSLRRAMVMADDSTIGPQHFEFATHAAGTGEPSRADGTADGQCATLKNAKSEAEAAAVRRALQEANANVTRAAERLGVSRVTFYKLMRKHDIRRAPAEGTS